MLLHTSLKRLGNETTSLFAFYKKQVSIKGFLRAHTLYDFICLKELQKIVEFRFFSKQNAWNRNLAYQMLRHQHRLVLSSSPAMIQDLIFLMS